jgi:hypothetical protein
METELQALGWSEADAKAIAALPVEVRYFDVGDDVLGDRQRVRGAALRRGRAARLS